MGTKYHGRDEASSEQTASLYRRVNRIETTQGPADVMVVTAADYATPPLTISSGSFTTLAHLWLAGRRNGIEVYCRVLTPVGVAMEMRLLNFGVPISPVASVGANLNDFQGLRGLDPGAYITDCELQARVSIGAGTCRVGVLRAIGGSYNSELFL